jgi:hypothetical protein
MHGQRKKLRCSKQILGTKPHSVALPTGHLHTRQLLIANKEQLRQTLPKPHLSRKTTNIIRHCCLYTSRVAVYWLHLLRQVVTWHWLVSQRGGPGLIPHYSVRFLVDKVETGQGFLPYLGVAPVSITPTVLHS